MKESRYNDNNNPILVLVGYFSSIDILTKLEAHWRVTANAALEAPLNPVQTLKNKEKCYLGNISDVEIAKKPYATDIDPAGLD